MLKRWKVKEDALESLRRACKDVNDGLVLNDCIMQFFEPDNTITFADLKPGQVFKWDDDDSWHLIKLDDDTAASNASGEWNLWAVTAWPPNAEGRSPVIPGKIIDGKFVPDEEIERP